MSYLETREGRRAQARANPVARDYMRSTTGWHIVRARDGERGGMRAHRGVLHRDEYVDDATLRPMVERRLGFTYEQVRSVYSTGSRLPASRHALRAAVDARLLTLLHGGANMDLLGRAVGINPSTLDRAVARAKQATARLAP